MGAVWRRWMGQWLAGFCVGLGVACAAVAAWGQGAASSALGGRARGPELVILDTDIGDDIDDVFAVGLALVSPEVKVIGVMSAWGETRSKARLLERLLCETGESAIPVAVGVETKAAGPLRAGRWAGRGSECERARVASGGSYPGAADFLLGQIKAHPGEITLIGLGPLTNLGAAVKQDPGTFGKLKRIVIMGGSVRRGYGASAVPAAEYNIVSDVPAAQAVLGSGVPLYVLPLDSTQIGLDEARREQLFALSTPLTDAMALMYDEWWPGFAGPEPVLFDAVAVAYAVDAAQCPTTAMRLEVDGKGFTREVAGGKANAFVCLRSEEGRFFDFYMARLLGQRLGMEGILTDAQR